MSLVNNEIEKDNNYGVKFFDITMLEENVDYFERVAYLTDFTAGVSKLEQKYYKVYLRDINGKCICGMLFNIGDFDNTGMQMSAFKNKLVSINFSAQVRDNMFSVILTNIAICREPISLDRFVGKLSNASDYREKITVLLREHGLEKTPRETLLTESFQDISSGVVGGYLKFYYKVLKCVINLSIDEDSIDIKDILLCTIYSLDIFSQYKQRENLLQFVSNIERLTILNKCSKIKNEFVGMVVSDCVSGLLNLGNPEHLYANIIYKSINLIMNVDSWMSVWNLIPSTTSKELKDKTILTKY